VRPERALLFPFSMRWLVALPTLGATPLLACADASDKVQGGDPLFDVAKLGSMDGSVLDAPTACQPGGANGGHSFTDLYACYFGPTGVVSCESQSTCHGAADEQGARSSKYVCAPTQGDCYQGMLAGGLIAPGSMADPTMSLLYFVLCKFDPSSPSQFTGQMPKNCPPATWLKPGDLASIGAWIKEGAPNN
jgi:hypothetical protein